MVGAGVAQVSSSATRDPPRTGVGSRAGTLPMARRQLLTEEERASVFGVPTERAALARHYTLAPGDLDFLAARRGAANRLGAATWMALLRHPGFGLRHDKAPPRELIAYLADQLGLSEALFTVYGRRAKTRLVEIELESLAHRVAEV